MYKLKKALSTVETLIETKFAQIFLSHICMKSSRVIKIFQIYFSRDIEPFEPRQTADGI